MCLFLYVPDEISFRFKETASTLPLVPLSVSLAWGVRTMQQRGPTKVPLLAVNKAQEITRTKIWEAGGFPADTLLYKLTLDQV